MKHIRTILAHIARPFVRSIGLACMATAILLMPALTAVAPQEQGDAISRQVDALFAAINRSDTPGASVLVIKSGMVLHRKGYGSANLEHQIPITPESVFDIASVSKQFTGMAISMLIEADILNLDDDVRDYIPELPDFGNTITVRHLVHHMSGVRDWPGTLAVAGWHFEDRISFDQILTMAYHQQALNFDPGERFLYSNTGYNLLAELVSRVTGKTFRAWTHENLFVPLGMEDTHFQDDHRELIPLKVDGYDREDGRYEAVPASDLIRKAAQVDKGSSTARREMVGTISSDQVRQIAEKKMPDLNANDVEGAMKIVAGTARSMGITVSN